MQFPSFSHHYFSPMKLKYLHSPEGNSPQLRITVGKYNIGREYSAKRSGHLGQKATVEYTFSKLNIVNLWHRKSSEAYCITSDRMRIEFFIVIIII